MRRAKSPNLAQPMLTVLVSLAATSLSLWAALHAALYKREPRSITLWMLLCFLLPGVGAVLYFLLGINRVRRKARKIRPQETPNRPESEESAPALPNTLEDWKPLIRLGHTLSARRLESGNALSISFKAHEAYAAMLEAIRSARRSIALQMYIFDLHGIGSLFVDALVKAQQRGVVVCILLDDAGLRYARPNAAKAMESRGLKVARFSPLSLRNLHVFNLRNHRKVLVVDGAIGFTGGLNIKREYDPAVTPSPYQDAMLRVEGPAVAHLMDVFADDWMYLTRESLEGPLWFPTLEPKGTGWARAIEAGPDATMDRHRHLWLGALAMARSRVTVITPYFLPDHALMESLITAALRGVRVRIVLPDSSNLPWVHWATLGSLWPVLHGTCEVYLISGPFNHAKLFAVDETWACTGSTNWDPRSLRLNFELVVETFDAALATSIHKDADLAIGSASPLSTAAYNAWPLGARLRNGVFRVLAPFF